VPAYLEVSRAGSTERLPLTSHDQFTVGSHPACDLVLPDHSVSRLHAVIDHFGPTWCVSDVSAQGTFVHGARLAGLRVPVGVGTPIMIGETSLTLHEYDSLVDVADETVEPPAPPPLTPAEQRVLVALCRPLATDGLVRTPASVAQMAERLDANFQTIKFHLRNLYAKFDVPEAGTDRRARLADAAIRSGAVRLSAIRRVERPAP
jgi:DNA-binding CsgD family transcriptional regulator